MDLTLSNQKLACDVGLDDLQSELLPDVEVPEGFDRDSWMKLVEGFASENDEISSVLAMRGQGGSQKGRPTNFKAGYKGELSSSTRAIQQRDRAALRSEEEKAVESARTADRSAKYQLKKKLQTTKVWESLSKKEKAFLVKEQGEEQAAQRFADKKSAEWLESTLAFVHKKWTDIYHQVDMKKHSNMLKKIRTSGESSTSAQPRGAKRLFGASGILEKLQRQQYEEGLEKLNKNTFEHKEAKQEWLDFVSSLDKEEMSMVTDENWQQRDPTPPPEYSDAVGNVKLKSKKPYVMGNESDECEEEVDDDSEIDEYYNQGEDKYESQEEYDKMQGVEDEEESEWEGFSD